MPISCEDCRTRLSELVDEDGSAPAEVAAHLDTCAACARELTLLRALRAELHALPMMAAPPDLRTRIQAELQPSSHASQSAVLPVSPGHGFLAGLRRFFQRPSNVAWTSGLALAAFCLLLIARPEKMHVIVEPPSGPALSTSDKAVSDRAGRKDSAVRRSTVKAAAPQAKVPQAEALADKPAQRTKSTAPVPDVASPKPPATPFRSEPMLAPVTRPLPLDSLLERRVTAIREPHAANKATVPRADSSLPATKPMGRSGQAKAMGELRADKSNQTITGLAPPLHQPLKQELNEQNTTPKLMPEHAINGAALPSIPAPTVPLFNRTLSGADLARPRSELNLSKPTQPSRPLLARLEWLPVDARREAGAKADAGKDELMSKSVHRGGGGAATEFGVGPTFGLQQRRDNAQGSAQRKPAHERAYDSAPTPPRAAPDRAANSAAGAAEAPAAPGVPGPQGPSGPPGAAGRRNPRAAAGVVDSTAGENKHKGAFTHEALPPALAAPDKITAENSLMVEKRDQPVVMNAPAATTAPLRVGDRREARLTIVPPQNVASALVQLTLAPGLRLAGQTAGGGTHTLWFGQAQAGRAIVIPLSIIAVRPGAQTLHINLRAAGHDAKSVADGSEMLSLNVLPR